MGLSNEERMHKIFYAIRNVVECSRKMNSEGWYEYTNPYKKLKELAEKLWPSMYKNKGNSSFWLFGSEEEVTAKNYNVWSVPLYNHIKHNKEPREKEDDKYVFDPFDGFLDVRGLLTDDKKRIALDLYVWLQQYLYAVNRYEDELSESFNETSTIIGQMMGELFSVFEEGREDFSAAYLLNAICKKIYGRMSYMTKEELDPLALLLEENNTHHCIKNWTLYKWEKVNNAKRLLHFLEEDSSIRNRLLVAMEIGGDSFAEYPHVEKKLKVTCKKLRINFKKYVAPVLAKVRAAKKENKENDSKHYAETREFYKKDLLT